MIKKYQNSLKFRSIFLVAASFLLLTVLVSCGEKKEVQRATPVAPVAKKEQDEKITEESKEQEEVVYEYEAEGKRDPFKPFIKKQKIKKVETIVPLTPLQRYDITQLKLTGIITAKQADQSRAMVEDPAGKGYVLKVGTLIGKNFGRVSNIMLNRVIVTEEIQDFLGNIITKEIPLTLEIEEGE